MWTARRIVERKRNCSLGGTASRMVTLPKTAKRLVERPASGILGGVVQGAKIHQRLRHCPPPRMASSRQQKDRTGRGRTGNLGFCRTCLHAGFSCGGQRRRGQYVYRSCRKSTYGCPP